MIRYAALTDLDLLKELDIHIDETTLRSCIIQNRIIVLSLSNILTGWLRFNLFWDSIPFINMLYLSENSRGKGYGTQLLKFWETEMANKGYGTVLTSTLSNEQAQFFYRKNGYQDCGSLLLPGEPLEIIFIKNMKGTA